MMKLIIFHFFFQKVDWLNQKILQSFTNSFFHPLSLCLHPMFSEEFPQTTVPIYGIKWEQKFQFCVVYRAQIHGLTEIFFQMSRAIHAARVVDTVSDSQQMHRLMDQQPTTSLAKTSIALNGEYMILQVWGKTRRRRKERLLAAGVLCDGLSSLSHYMFG